MKVNMDTFKTIAYVLRKKSQGYKLLKNPKGTSPYEVNMIKSDFFVSRDYHDEIFNDVKITRKKVGDKFVEDSVDIFSEYLTDPVTKTRSGKKNVFVSIKKDGNIIEKEKWGEPDIYERPLPQWENNEKRAHVEALLEKNSDRQRGFYQPDVPVLAKMITFGDWKRVLGLEMDKRPFAPSFWSILKENLSNIAKN